jgi:Golgin subfamily A member 7/ERF4 family.
MASWILRKQIPKSIPRKLIVIPPEGNLNLYNLIFKGRAFVSGLSYSYKEYFPTEIEPYVSFDEYQRIITDINETLMTYWPCLFSLCLGYICCPFTLGLSLLIPKYRFILLFSVIVYVSRMLKMP